MERETICQVPSGERVAAESGMSEFSTGSVGVAVVSVLEDCGWSDLSAVSSRFEGEQAVRLISAQKVNSEKTFFIVDDEVYRCGLYCRD